MLFKFVLIIILIIILIYFFCPPKIIDRYISSPDKIYDKSAGVFDDPAKEALEITKNKKNKTADDHFRIGDILTLNVLEGHVDNPEIVKEAADHYHIAMRIVTPERIQQHNINIVNDFARLMNDPHFIEQQRILINDIIASRRKKVQAIKEKAKNPGEYFTGAIEHKNDSQNSHDSEVGNDISKTLIIIKNDLNVMNSNNSQKGIGELKFDIDEIKNGIAKMPDKKREQATRGLTAVQTKNEYIEKNKMHELEILELIWLRSYFVSPSDEKNNTANIQEAILDALADINGANAYKEDYIVCAKGRVSRIVAALSGIDINPEVGNIQTQEQKHNYIMESAGGLWLKFLEDNKNGKYKDIVAAFNNGNDLPKDKEIEYFKEEFKKIIDSMLADTHATPDVRKKVYEGVDSYLL